MSAERRASGLILIAASGYAMLAIGTGLAARDGVSLPTLMAWRYALAAPLLALIAGAAAFRVPWRRALPLLVLGGGGQSLVTWLSLSALEWLPAAALGFLFYTYPAWVAIFAAVTGLERLTALRVGALAVALVGITLMVGLPWASTLPLEGVLRALGSAVVYALYIPMIHRLRGPLDAAAASTWIIGGAAIVFVLMATLSASAGGFVANMTPRTWGIAIFLAGFSTVVAFITFLHGLAVLGAVRTAILSTTEPFWTAVLAALLLAQPIGPTTIAGGLCIVGAIVLLQRSTPAPSVDAPAPT
ncbi:MAG: DMT family transporter [Gemmatimonadaceae bacterium]